jgi:two-component system, chemotaxis family, response regulator Rcp1
MGEAKSDEIQSAHKPIDILLVEDSPTDADILQEAMAETKIRNSLHVVTDGVAALQYLRQQGVYENAVIPDLILLDLNLPKKDGREVLAEIKQDEILRSIPVVVLTSSRSEEDIAKSYHLHANCYISKPLDLDRFVDIIKQIDEFWFAVVKLPKR